MNARIHFSEVYARNLQIARRLEAHDTAVETAIALARALQVKVEAIDDRLLAREVAGAA